MRQQTGIGSAASADELERDMPYKGNRMKGRYYHISRAIHFFVSFVILSLVLFLLPTPMGIKIIFLVIGVVLGYVLGQFDWKKTRSRVDKRNVVILYATDSGFYSILMLLFLLQFAPRSIASFVKVLQNHPFILPLFIGVISSTWVAYNFTIWRGVKHFETVHGRLITKYFWSPSLVGQQGMISKGGIVIEKCAPIGKVQIGSEIWMAESIDGREIDPFDRILVRDMDGLKLIVENVTDA